MTASDEQAPTKALTEVPGLPAAAAQALAAYGFQGALHVAEVAAQADGRRGLLAVLTDAGLAPAQAEAALQAVEASLSPAERIEAAQVPDTRAMGLGALDPALLRPGTGTTRTGDTDGTPTPDGNPAAPPAGAG